jgi:hypothetical protein
MPTSRYVRFTGGPEMPTGPTVSPSAGAAIAEHLVATLPSLGVEVLGHDDLEYAHEVRCRVGTRTFALGVSYDWEVGGWWEVFWPTTIGFFGRLLGRSEALELRTLAEAVDRALGTLAKIQEKRWYEEWGVAVGPDAPYAMRPDLS